LLQLVESTERVAVADAKQPSYTSAWHVLFFR